MWGLEQALSDTTNEALRSPSAEGLKATVTVNFCPARRVEPLKQYPLMFAARLSALQLWSAATRLAQELQVAVLPTPISNPVQRWLNSIVHWVVRLESERLCAEV
jgi:hypothetical protein